MTDEAHTVPVDGVSHRLDVRGQGPLCVVVPDGAEPLALPAALAAHVRLASLIPTGWPDGRPASLTPSGQPDGRRLLDAVVAHLGGGPIFLLGHGRGGAVAQRYAADRPSAVSGLILYAATPPGAAPMRVAVPTLILAGARDAVGARRAAVLHDNIPDSDLLVLHDSGPLAHLDQPAAFTGAVADFINLVAEE